MSDEQFYLVWNPKGGSPTKRHSSEFAAEQEAKRLAEIHRQDVFYVLRATKAVNTVDVQVRNLRDNSF